MLILITYELTRPEEEYTRFYNSLNGLGEGKHYLQSTWLVNTEEKPRQIKKILEGYMSPDDKLFIVKITSDYAGTLPKRAWRWIDKETGSLLSPAQARSAYLWRTSITR